MSPISIHRPPAVEHVQTRDSRLDADRTSATDFASMLAGAVQQKVEKPEPKRPEGTSELDRPEDKKTDEADEPKKTKRMRARAVQSAPPSNVVDTTAALDPELQAKLARVAARMKEETGLDVTVTDVHQDRNGHAIVDEARILGKEPRHTTSVVDVPPSTSRTELPAVAISVCAAIIEHDRCPHLFSRCRRQDAVGLKHGVPPGLARMLSISTISMA